MSHAYTSISYSRLSLRFSWFSITHVAVTFNYNKSMIFTNYFVFIADKKILRYFISCEFLNGIDMSWKLKAAKIFPSSRKYVSLFYWEKPENKPRNYSYIAGSEKFESAWEEKNCDISQVEISFCFILGVKVPEKETLIRYLQKARNGAPLFYWKTPHTDHYWHSVQHNILAENNSLKFTLK